ncbi:MAG: phage holin family protein [Prochloraceae cyanobacterium]|nr:phage holin family protein [Prochloraceae cyanobacterium]
MPQFLVTWILTSISLLITAEFIPGITISTVNVAIVAAVILGLINAIVKPILIIFTLPLTILSLGLFLFVVNAISFGLVAYFTPGFEVNGFFDALLGCILLSIVSGLLNSFFQESNN